MKYAIVLSAFALSSCVATESRTPVELRLKAPLGVVEKICTKPKDLGLVKFSPDSTGEIDARYEFYSYGPSEGAETVFVDGFNDGCLRYFLTERTSY